MIIVPYESDAERKRLEYVLEKYNRRLRLKKPRGAVIIASGNENDELKLLDELIARLGSEKVVAYRITGPVEKDPESVHVSFTLPIPPAEAWGALTAVMSRMRGALVSRTGSVRVYSLTTRGARATVKVSLSGHGEGSRGVAVFEGYGGRLSRLAEKFCGEVRVLGGGCDKG
ncbi:MAG: hypothetical protein LRS48_05140 [Desulfurococcales archaeon]|nr:hypothetical protein [Desulfurococcales archaeon]